MDTTSNLCTSVSYIAHTISYILIVWYFHLELQNRECGWQFFWFSSLQSSINAFIENILQKLENTTIKRISTILIGTWFFSKVGSGRESQTLEFALNLSEVKLDQQNRNTNRLGQVETCFTLGFISICSSFCLCRTLVAEKYLQNTAVSMAWIGI